MYCQQFIIPRNFLAETDVEVFSIPSVLFSEWIKKYDVWLKFIFNLVSEWLSDIFSVVKEIDFRHIDVRIADRLSKIYEEMIIQLK